MADTLSDEALADIREVVGDDCTPYTVTDNDRIQAWYDEADGDLPTTYVYYLRRLWGKATREPKNLITLPNGAQVNQKAAQYKKLLDYWEAQAGIAPVLGTLTVGSFNLGIDAIPDDE
jgi:hypothetical protein